MERRPGTPDWSWRARSVWGKSSGYDGEAWLPLVQHLEDTANVAGHVWGWLPPRTRQMVEAALPKDTRDGKVLLCWLAGIHDVGKASAPFATKVPTLADRMRTNGLIAPRDSTDFAKAPHGIVGHLTLAAWLQERYDAQQPTAETYAVVVGGHHGIPPTKTQLRWLSHAPHLTGEAAWRETQWEILDEMAAATCADVYLPAWAATPLPATVQAALTGAVIVADWLASNTELFPYDTMDKGARAALAWQTLGLPASWSPHDPTGDVAQQLRIRFPVLSAATPRPVQAAAVRAAHNCDAAPLLIIESAMGSGKTEAALLAAEVLAYRFGCGGIFFGLPTMATSDAMFGRVLDWVNGLDGAGVQSTFLAHGKAGLNDQFQGLGRQHGCVDVYDEDGNPTRTEARVQAWLTGRKKGVLANMVVGTIDQLLFMALQAKHAALRHLSFTGKVVIIDEVHAADSFMRMYLVRALEWLAAYGVPVVLLSATLPGVQRQELADAYRAGLGLPREVLEPAPGYPLLTTVAAPGTTRHEVEDDSVEERVDLEVIDDDLKTLSAMLADWLVEGGCVAVIVNTVTRAQGTAAFLADRFGADVVVLHHSRFIATHRAAREARLRDELGPSSGSRPDKCIVVGTQVLEQSLDVDFDAMVTDLAPVDLMLQRMGRLHRHPRGANESGRPPPLWSPRVAVRGIAEWQDEGTPVPARGSRTVYGNSLLLRAAGALKLSAGGRATVTLPTDIRPLVEAAYAEEPPVPGAWRTTAEEADRKHRNMLTDARRRADIFRLRSAHQKSLVGWLEDSSTEADDGRHSGSARVRDGEDGIEVVVTQRIDGEVVFIKDDSDYAGRPIPTTMGPPDTGLARELAATTVRLPAAMTSPAAFDRTVTALEMNAYEGWQQSPWLAGQLVIHLDENWRTVVGDFALSYDLERGLTATRGETA